MTYLSRLTPPDSFTLNSNVETPIAFRNPVYGSAPDQFDEFNNFTAKVCGWHYFEASIEIQGDIPKSRLSVFGSRGEGSLGNFVGAGQLNGITGTTIAKVTASFFLVIGDLVAFRALQTSGSDVSSHPDGRANYVKIEAP